ncbi:hypothetical protein [Klebsiella grimontii]|uniref:hypothetical protein n=1 Tax=Klebsiella grimontii TaxID=2058152 RepID=UPI001CCAE5DA|nr:hypothetical protein [Klebsiella grimontii]
MFLNMLRFFYPIVGGLGVNRPVLVPGFFCDPGQIDLGPILYAANNLNMDFTVTAEAAGYTPTLVITTSLILARGMSACYQPPPLPNWARGTSL